MKNLLKYIVALLIICGMIYFAFYEDMGTEEISIWVFMFFVVLFMIVSISLYTSQLFNVSNKLISSVPSNTGNKNNMLESYRLGHQPYSISAKLINEIIRCTFKDNVVKNVHFIGVYSGFNRQIRTNPGDTLFVGPAHLFKKIGGDFIVMGRLIKITKQQLFGYIGCNKDFYNRIVLKNTKHIFVPSTISTENKIQHRSIDNSFELDSTDAKRFDRTISWLQKRCNSIENYSNNSWDEFSGLQDRLLDVLRANKAQSIAVRDAQEEIRHGDKIQPTQIMPLDEQDERYKV